MQPDKRIRTRERLHPRSLIGLMGTKDPSQLSLQYRSTPITAPSSSQLHRLESCSWQGQAWQHPTRTAARPGSKELAEFPTAASTRRSPCQGSPRPGVGCIALARPILNGSSCSTGALSGSRPFPPEPQMRGQAFGRPPQRGTAEARSPRGLPWFATVAAAGTTVAAAGPGEAASSWRRCGGTPAWGRRALGLEPAQGPQQDLVTWSSLVREIGSREPLKIQGPSM